jgi:hypothetical protein
MYEYACMHAFVVVVVVVVDVIDGCYNKQFCYCDDGTPRYCTPVVACQPSTKIIHLLGTVEYICPILHAFVVAVIVVDDDDVVGDGDGDGDGDVV